MIKRRGNWYTLDNAAKLYPPVASKNDPKIFRFSCELKEQVDKWKLQDALDKTVEQYPVFNSEIKTGFFWHYLEISSVKAMVKEETKHPCSCLKTKLLFEVTYYKNRINLEVSHALSDGTGSLEFMKSLIKNYLGGNEKNNIPYPEQEIDSYTKYYTPKFSLRNKGSTRAFQIKGKKYTENRLKIMEGIVNTNAIKKDAKQRDCSITVYLTALLIKSILLSYPSKIKKKPIVITIPVDLRKHFPSKSVRNFFNVIHVRYKKTESDSFENILAEVKKQFEEQLDEKQIQMTMNKNAFYEKLLFVRLIPLVFKNIVLKYSYQYSRLYHTLTLSNIGKINVEKKYAKRIRLLSVFTSTDGMQVCVCSMKDTMVITFTSHFLDTNMQQHFFKELANHTEVTIHTNVIEGYEKRKEESVFPKIESNFRYHEVMLKILFALSMIGMFVSLLINFIIAKQISWSLFVVAGIFSFWFTIKTAFNRKNKIYKILFLEMLLLLLLSIFIDYKTGFLKWSLTYVLPFLCISYIIAFLIYRIFFQPSRINKDYLTYTYLNSFIGILPLYFILHDEITVYWPSIISISMSFLAVFFLLIFNSKTISNELERRFHF